MRRTTITLPDNVALAVQREARRRRVSVSEVVRQALALGLGIGREGRRVLPFAAIGRSGHQHTARDLEGILAAEWGMLAVLDSMPSLTRTTTTTTAAGPWWSGPTSSSSSRRS